MIEQSYEDIFHDFSVIGSLMAIYTEILPPFPLVLIIFNPVKKCGLHVLAPSSNIFETLFLPVGEHGEFSSILPSPYDFAEFLLQLRINFMSPGFFANRIECKLPSTFFHEGF